MANKKRLDTTMETDFLQSFVRGNLTTETTDAKDEKPSSKRRESKTTNSERVDILTDGSKDELVKSDKVNDKESKSVKTIKVPELPGNVCSKFMAQKAKEKAKQSGKKKIRKRTIKSEELYTDKDRAAAVNLGTKDIKHSLKLKRQQDRSKNLHLADEADPAQLLALGYYELKKQETQIALNFINKALELNPNDKQALVARSKCYILLGQPESGLKDAEAALEMDKKFLKAIYQKAEALYFLGDFEHSLMYFHRGLHIRPDHEDFKLGVEKAQKAIETALGVGVPKPKQRSKSATPSLSIKLNDDNNNLSFEKSSSKCKEIATNSDLKPKNLSRKNCKVKNNGSKLLKELAIDKEYLESLLTNPDLKSVTTKETEKVLEYVQETVDYLNKRQEFWRQQVPKRT